MITPVTRPKPLIMLLVLVVASGLIQVNAQSAISIEDRIRSTVAFLRTRYYSEGVSGFLHDTSQTRRFFSEDNGFAALALAAYQETHFSNEFDQYLKYAVEFLRQAQTGSGDFYEFYDLATSSWGAGGKLYYWNSYALLGPAYAAYAITTQVSSERIYWAGVIRMLGASLDYWIPKTQQLNGAIQFSFPGKPDQADLAANGAMLAALIHVALFEHTWGDKFQASKYVNWSRKIAQYLYTLQEKSNSTHGFGGYYTNETSKLELAYDNGLAMFGLNSYYKAVSLLLPELTPTHNELRQPMIDWIEGFANKTLDSWGGSHYGRRDGTVLEYPKSTKAAASMLQASVDVWINVGPSRYWEVASKIYKWITGANELSRDLQILESSSSANGAFNQGIDHDQLIFDPDLATTSLTLYAVNKAAFILITGPYPVPEFSTSTITMAGIILLCALVYMNGARERRPRLQHLLR